MALLLPYPWGPGSKEQFAQTITRNPDMDAHMAHSVIIWTLGDTYSLGRNVRYAWVITYDLDSIIADIH